ncbi:MAG TPA: patatin-like phospholipase family protein [Candidatus Eremiobacteraceae bacterium]|nr:patatin-like phospholipase family protein [Candidatus Eremiobacteraceae bacterium]
MPEARRQMDSHLDKLIDGAGPKKLLSIDGGGIRGLIAIEFLSRIEAILRDRSGRSDLVLGDYFDYVGGTSTGAIVATLISMGFATKEIREFYVTGAHTMFDPSNVFLRLERKVSPNSIWAKLLNSIGMLTSSAMYTQKALAAKIKSVIGTDGDVEATLGTSKLRTLLLIVMRNASSDSPWPISNNPRAKFNRRGLPDCNLDLPLWQLVRASTAAPVFFPPEVINIGDQQFVFVDGAVTVYHNPAFLLFLMATLPPYELQWPTGEDKLLLVSVGTGLSENVNLRLRAQEMNLLYNVQSLPAALIHAATVEQDLLCRVFGKTRAGDALDAEVGDLVGNRAPLSEKLFTYARYNVDLSRQGLDRLGLNAIDEKAVQPFDIEHLDDLQTVGKTAARRCVSPEDFAGFA